MKTYTLLVLVAVVGALHALRITREVPLSTGHFSGRQEGDAFSKVNSDSDTTTGITKSGMKGIVANSGKLRGAVDAQSANGGMSKSAYAGDMNGQGGLWSDTNSEAGPDGQKAKTALKGYMNDKGEISGSIGAGAKGA